LFALLVLALLTSGCISQANDSGAKGKLVTVRFTVEFPDRNESKDWIFPGGGNALTAFRQAFSVQTRQYAFGEMVDSIGGTKADSSHYWALYVNDEYATKGISDYKIASGMQITWKYDSLSDFGK